MQLTLELVRTVPSVRSRLQAKWRHVLVDEVRPPSTYSVPLGHLVSESLSTCCVFQWQDTNVPQYELVRQIATPTTPDHTDWW